MTSLPEREERSAYESLPNDHHRAFIDYLAAGRFQHEAYHDSIYKKGRHRGERLWETDKGIYHTCATAAWRLLKNVEYREALRERCAEKVMSREEVLARLSQEAANEQAAYIRGDGTVDLEALIGDGKAHLIKGTRFNAQSTLIVEFQDSQAAKKLILQSYDRVGTKDSPLHVEGKIKGIDFGSGE